VHVVFDVATADVPGVATCSDRSIFGDAAEEVACPGCAQVFEGFGNGELDVLLRELVGRGIGINVTEPIDHRVSAGARVPESIAFGREIGERVER
jgi:hypothetical protein